MPDQSDDMYDIILNEIMVLERNAAASERNISTQRQNEIRTIIQKYTLNKVTKNEA